jgi:pimeloyl-ACP methyl ester carboxylesterase
MCVRLWPGHGATLVFLHGLLDSSEGWAALCGAIGGTRIAFDLPGFGYSDPPPTGSLTGYAEDVAEALEGLGADRFTLVGHSLGGAVGATLAELMPERVEALVLLAPAGFGHVRLADAVSMPGVRFVVQAALRFLLSNDLAIRAAYAAIVTNGTAPDRALVERVTCRGAALVDGAREGTRAVVEAARSPDALHRRRLRYRGPVHAVWGDRDRLVPPAHAEALRAALPQARIEIWPGMAHHPMRERFDDLVALVGRAALPSPAQSAVAGGHRPGRPRTCADGAVMRCT